MNPIDYLRLGVEQYLRELPDDEFNELFSGCAHLTADVGTDASDAALREGCSGWRRLARKARGPDDHRGTGREKRRPRSRGTRASDRSCARKPLNASRNCATSSFETLRIAATCKPWRTNPKAAQLLISG